MRCETLFCKLVAELKAIDYWDKAYLESGGFRAEVERIAFRIRQRKREEVLLQISNFSTSTERRYAVKRKRMLSEAPAVSTR